jgi:hypothetical protein
LGQAQAMMRSPRETNSGNVTYEHSGACAARNSQRGKTIETLAL